jgi:hypothetical protein
MSKPMPRPDISLTLGIPRRLSQMTPEQVEGVIEFFVSLPLVELRKRQSIAAQQLDTAWGMRDEIGNMAVANIQINQELLAEAIMRQQFPDEGRRTISLSRWLS